MRTELDRSAKELKQDSFGPPYFLAYRLHEQRRWDVAASFGAAVQAGDAAFRVLYVESRFGDRALDNTDLSFHGLQGLAGGDAKSLRRQLWNLTDAAYKTALSGFLEKKARRATEFVPEVLDDFSVEPATAAAREGGFETFDREALTGLVERVSAVFRRHPFVYDSNVALQLRWARRYLLTSEGTRLATPGDSLPASIQLAAMTRAEDGMRLDAYRQWSLRGIADLPPEAELVAEAETLARQLKEQRAAPVQGPTAAPAILDQESAGVLFHEALGHKLEGQRQRDPQQSQLFKDRVGQSIIPAFLSVYDDPTLTSFKGRALGGSYEFDSEGVPARRVTLVERGVLRGFLMSRWPVKGFSRSNGHGRSDAGRHPSGRMANLIVKTSSPVDGAELKRRLMDLARRSGKPYGFRLVGSSGGENPGVRASAQTFEVRPRLIYRVDAATGEETLVRGVKMVGTPLVLLNRVTAAGGDDEAASGFMCGAESGSVPVSQISPSVLISEVELQRLPEDRSRPPILPAP